MAFDSDIVVFDLEASCKTFGRNEIEECNIIEIGAVRLDRKSLSVVTEFSALVKPRDYPILPEIADITGITPDMVSEAPYFDMAAAAFLEWYGPKNKAILAAFGTYYDLPLLRKEFRVFDLDYGKHFVGGGLDIKSLCIAWLARHKHSTSAVTVSRMLEKLGLVTDFEFHRALDDARATALIFQAVMVDGRE